MAAALAPVARAYPSAVPAASVSDTPLSTSVWYICSYVPAAMSAPCCTAPVPTAPRTAAAVPAIGLINLAAPRAGISCGACSAIKLSSSPGSLAVSENAVKNALICPVFSASDILAERSASRAFKPGDFMACASACISLPIAVKPVS